MKKIVSLTFMTLTLCMQHESQAISDVNVNKGKATLLFEQLKAMINGSESSSLSNAEQFDQIEKELNADPDLKQAVAEKIEGQRKSLYRFLEWHSHTLSRDALTEEAQRLVNTNSIQRKLGLKPTITPPWWWPSSK